MSRLFVRVLGGADGRLEWLVLNDAGRVETHAGGDAADLAAVVRSLPRATDTLRAVAFVPTADVVALKCSIPGRTAAQLRRAAPYAVEPFVTEDIDSMHVACGPLSRHEPVRCLATRREAMRGWLETLTAADLTVGHLTAEAMALPAQEGTITVLYDGNDALVRTADEMAGVDAENVASTLALLLGTNGGAKLCQVNGGLPETDLRAAGFAPDEVENRGGGSVLELLARGFDPVGTINLLQGEFAAKRRPHGAMAGWRAAAAVAGAWLAIGLAVVVAQGFWANQRADAYHAEADALYRDIYGAEQAPANPAARMRVRLGQAPETRLGFHRLLGQLGVALSELRGRYELRSVSYNERSGFGADVLVADYDVLDELKTALSERGLELEIVSAEQHEDRARARLRIADRPAAADLPG